MGYNKFLNWVEKNCPEGDDPDDFVEYLAMIGATMFDEASKNTGKSVQELIQFHFSNRSSLTDA